MASPTSPVSVDSSRTISVSPVSQNNSVDIETFTVNSAVPEMKSVTFPSIGSRGRVSEFSSMLDATAVQNLAKKYMFPETCVLVVPREIDRACSPPVGFITLYEDSLVNGLRFPLHPIYIELQHLFGIQLGQLMPNSYKQIVALGVEANRRNMPLSPAMLFRFYGFKVSDSWFYLSPRLGFRVKTKSKIANWQRKFFFCDAEDVFPHVWRTGRLDDFWSEDTFGELEKLGIISEEYSEVDLALAGLSPYDPATMVEPVKVNFEISKKRKQPSSAADVEKTTSKSSKKTATTARVPAPVSPPPAPKKGKEKGKEKAGTRGTAPPAGSLAIVTVEGRVERESSAPTVERPESIRRCLAEVADKYERAALAAMDFEGERAALIQEANEAKAEAARANKRASAEVVALKAEVTRAKAGAEAHVAEAGAARAVAEAAKAEAEAARGEAEATRSELEATRAELEAARAEVEAARAREAEVAHSQGQTFRAFAERLFLSGRFSLLAGDLAEILTSSVAADAVEEVAAAFPDLDLSRFMVEVPSREVQVRDYASVLVAGMKDFPVLEELASSSTLLTAEAIRACPVDRDSALERLVAEVGEGSGEGRQSPPRQEAAIAGGGSGVVTRDDVEILVEEEVPADRQAADAEGPHEEEAPAGRPETSGPPLV